ncbi:hypothetical protein HY968_05185 [Candidatus Kaiserbacteria bacterium]|nr:hypothetical protein [Candidatus Kaiserbacteria bacterium]
MNQLNVQKTALTTAIFLGGFHIVWSLIVVLGWGQSIYDFVLYAHMIHMPIVIGPFDLAAAAVLIIITAIIGYVIGYAFAYIWNRLHR